MKKLTLAGYWREEREMMRTKIQNAHKNRASKKAGLRNKALQMRRNGLTGYRIAKILNVHKNTIYDYRYLYKAIFSYNRSDSYVKAVIHIYEELIKMREYFLLDFF